MIPFASSLIANSKYINTLTPVASHLSKNFYELYTPSSRRNQSHNHQQTKKFHPTFKPQQRNFHNPLMAVKGEDIPETIRFLALHGKGGSGPNFESTLEPFISDLQSHFGDTTNIQFDFITAPFESGQWWTLPPGVRSFNANEYEGFDISANLIEETILTSSSQGNGYHFILGHSQGAILLSALITRNPNFLKQCNPSVRGFILNGAAWPNPYSDQVENFHFIHTIEKNSNVSSSIPSSCLFVIGKNDKINPPQGARKVMNRLQKGGMNVDAVNHMGGHSVPVNDVEATKEIIDWVEQVLKQ